jgi:hypothetical protein
MEVLQGLATTDNVRFLRCFWETGHARGLDSDSEHGCRWISYVKGGRYQKWAGLE